MAEHSVRALRIPLPDWILAYRKEWARPDVIAGLIAASVVIPKALAYATVAGLPVQAGLYTALVPMAIYAVLGSSRTLSVSTTTTIAILAGTALGQIATGNSANLMTASATLTLLVGAILILAGLLKLGFVANFISEPVLVGFKAGIGIVIIVDQLPKLLGLHFDKGSFTNNLIGIVHHIPQARWRPSVGVAVAERFPGRLVAVAGGIAAMRLLDLEAHGVEKIGVIPTGLPSVTLPNWELALQLWPAALGIALMSFTETIAAGRAFARGGEPVPQPNRELIATGIATAGGACLGAMPAGGGTSQTAVNTRAGARSQLAGLTTAATTVAALLLLAPLIGSMPNATLAAVVIVYSIGLIEPVEFTVILKVRRTEFVWALNERKMRLQVRISDP